jgi:ATP-grasp domain
MHIHEYQAKALLRNFGVAVPEGYPAFDVDDAGKAAALLPGPDFVVKSQIHAGGRGKGRFRELGADVSRLPNCSALQFSDRSFPMLDDKSSIVRGCRLLSARLRESALRRSRKDLPSLISGGRKNSWTTGSILEK